MSGLGGSFSAYARVQMFKMGTFYGRKTVVRKFLAGRIIEVPLIVLQYYKKPSFSIYIYIYKEKDLYKDLYLYILCKIM